MPEQLMEILTVITDKLVIPAVGLIISIILLKLETYLKTMFKSTEEKNKADQVNAEANSFSKILEQVKTIVEAAVASNMKMVESFKSDETPFLSQEEIGLLNTKAKELIYAMLPAEIREGKLLAVLGGTDALDKIIESLIESQLIALKALISQALTSSTVTKAIAESNAAVAVSKH